MLKLPAGLELTYLGHASFKVVTEGGQTVLFDPWLTGNPVLPESEKHQDKADLILITHGHGDHLDSSLPDIAAHTGASIAAPSAVIQYLSGLHVQNLLHIQPGGTIVIGELKVTMTNALHSSSIQTAEGKQAFPHEASGLILTTESGYRIYHAGDTGIFSEMELIGEIYKPDLVFLPIGDRATMGPLEASYATRLLGAQQVVPIHYATFPSLTGTAEDFKTELNARGLSGVTMCTMKPGDKITG
jgi:L-ascorbate metabolism protein UlaG (beta-lactamase superfamily)